ncbi:hypothetical protein T11_6834 [Trichinella zimbabwensis]|uniref:Uncharacterized protein n=1 Tax=Trichinella zimbabwensis TaxID=268475 RepID=A0A0V1DQ27_9BILA|nr:hypothetical protein T11_6834 [Trichinella zimbabwensis]
MEIIFSFKVRSKRLIQATQLRCAIYLYKNEYK